MQERNYTYDPNYPHPLELLSDVLEKEVETIQVCAKKRPNWVGVQLLCMLSARGG